MANKEKIVNQDIIDFRYDLIEKMCNPHLYPELDEYTMNKILVSFNVHFSMRDYELG